MSGFSGDAGGGVGGVTRLAPSPTGALHLGNARTFLINWALARRLGWDVALRIEDLDTPRVKPGSVEQTIDLISWLGMSWDGASLLQSADLEPYRAAMRALAEAGLVYPCTLTRKQIEAAASAPNETDKGEGGELRFDPALRPAGFERGRRARFDDEATNWRLAVEPGEIEVEDRVAGRHAIDVAREVGDFVVWTKRGCPSYQLAVVVDDARQGVTDVVRGRDLIPSAARQALLQRALGLATPRWWHVGLVRGEDGRRLAKRHGDTRLAGYRESGAPADRVVGLLAWWTGLTAEPEPMAAAEFAERLAVDSIVTRGRWADDVTFTREHERWLRG